MNKFTISLIYLVLIGCTQGQKDEVIEFASKDHDDVKSQV